MVVHNGCLKQELVLQHLPLVRMVAGQVKGLVQQHWDINDLEQYGVLGLMDAVEKFDEGRGIPFSVYAKKRIYGAIIDSVRKETWIPRSVLQHAKNIEEARSNLRHQLGREPDTGEIASFLDISQEQLSSRLSEIHARRISSLQLSLNGDSDRAATTLEDVISYEGTLEGEIVAKESHELLSSALEKLPARDNLLITLYYYEEMTLREIGCVLGVSESRVSQLHKRALSRLQNMLPNEVI